MSTASSLLGDLSEEAVWRLEAACCRFEQAWQAGRRPAPWEFLDAPGGTERLVLLRELLRLDVFYRRQAGEEPTAADYRPAHPDDEPVLRAVLGAPAGSALETTDARGDQRPGGGPPGGAGGDGERPADEAPLGGRYRVLRFHARGGLGEVHVAEDVELGREVALKEMQAGHAADPDTRSRFVLEGALTGALEHPGIVPVYGRGARPDGRPFYTMRLIRGETLAADIGRFHARAPVRFDAMAFRQLLGRFVAVCQAVAYAHSRGVIHRDLKPANVMLGPFGETLLLDWGLAKFLGGEGRAGAENPLRLADAGGAETMGAVGTPAYMSPEQATGSTAELGPATDVYGLGAILYEMLTGAPAFQGNLFEVLAKAACGDWAPPRQVNRAAPPGLDAVCRKAMALRPQDRYGSALELAKDVEAWLADEPVAAHAEPWGTRLRRWARKHPRQVTGGVVLLATAVAGLALGTVLLQRSKRQAENTYKVARQGVNHFLREVSEDVLLDEPGMQPLRQSLLDEALNYHEAFRAIWEDDPEGQQQQAETFRLRGELDGEVGRLAEGKAFVARAVARYEGLLRAKPAERGLRFGLARCWLSLAELHVQSGEPGAAREPVSRALEVLAALRAEEPGRVPVLRLLGRCHDLRATVDAGRGDLASALRANQEALAVLEQAVTGTLADWSSVNEKTAFAAASGFSGVPRSRSTEWRSYGHRIGADVGQTGYYRPEVWAHLHLTARAGATKGRLLAAAGRVDESARAMGEAVALLAWLSERRPRSGRLRHELALALLDAGRAEVELGRPAAAGRDLRKAVALLEKVGEQDPLVPEYQAGLLRARGFLGECLFVAGRRRAAAGLLRGVVGQADRLVQKNGADRRPLADHPRFLHVLGRIEADAGRLDEALALCERSARQQKQAAALAPRSPALLDELLRLRETLGTLASRKGRLGRDDRIREQRQILREWQERASGDPSSGRLRGEAGASAAELAGLLLEAGRPREALAVVEEALPPHEALVRADQQRWQAGEGSEQPGRSLWPRLRFSVGVGRGRATPPSTRFRAQWARLLALRGAALREAGQAGAAAEAVTRAVALGEEVARGKGRYLCPPWSWPTAWSALAVASCRQDPEPSHLIDLAGTLALASTLPGPGVPDAAVRAVRALHDLVAAGFDRHEQLRGDGRLAPLRGRRDFQAFLRHLQARANETPPAPLNP
jgi:serine/threonine-protein kinase